MGRKSHRAQKPGTVNFAFLGQSAEVERDTVFTTEYSMRSAMVAVKKLLEKIQGTDMEKLLKEYHVI